MREESSGSFKYNALQAHINHGDYVGEAGNSGCVENLEIMEEVPGQDDTGYSHNKRLAEEKLIELYLEDSIIDVFPNPAGNEIYLNVFDKNEPYCISFRPFWPGFRRRIM